MFVHEKIYETVLKNLLEKVKKMKMGDPMNEKVEEIGFADGIRSEKFQRIEDKDPPGAPDAFGGQVPFKIFVHIAFQVFE